MSPIQAFQKDIGCLDLACPIHCRDILTAHPKRLYLFNHIPRQGDIFKIYFE